MATQVNVREIILETLLLITRDGEYSHIALKNVLDKYQYLEKRERAFITRVVEGTLERQIEIDYIINQFSKVKVNKQKPVIRTILRSSVYQLKYMDHVPDSAVCNEAVKLAGKKGFVNLKGFVNGVLRNISRNLDMLSYPDPSNEIACLSVRYSLPMWMVEKWISVYGKETVEKMGKAFLEERPVTVRRNTAVVSKEEFEKELEKDGVVYRRHPVLPYAYELTNYDYLAGLLAFQKGYFYIQDISSMQVAEWAEPKEGDYVIDVCAAPGGKSLHVAEKLQLADEVAARENGTEEKTGRVEARDLTEYKTDLIWQNIDRSGLGNICAVCKDASVFDKYDEEAADLVIADLPCSGLGVLGKKPDLKYRVQPEDLGELADLQRKILTCAQAIVKEGGTLLYSTCTVNPVENIENVHWFLKEYPQFELDDITENICKELKSDVIEKGCIQFFPGVHDCDGFFIARFKKKA